MENQVQTKTIELKAKILLRTFEDEQTKKQLEYISVELPDPFGDEDFVNVPITPKWRNGDNGEVMFKFYAKKALRTAPEIEFPVTIKALSYVNKAKEKITYPGIVGTNPFNGEEMEFRIKGKDKDDKNVIIFNNLARDFLGLRPADGEAVD